MVLRVSIYVHLQPLLDGRDLCLQAATGTGTVLTHELAAVAKCFNTARDRDEAIGDLGRSLGISSTAVDAYIDRLIQRSILTQLTPEEEILSLARRLQPGLEVDPLQRLRQYRRSHTMHPLAYPLSASRRSNLGPGKVFHGILIGECDVHHEMGFLRGEAARRGFDLRVTATLPSDIRILAEMPHDAVLLGVLRARDTIADDVPATASDRTARFVDEARAMLARVRALTSAPILIDNLPIPTVEPLGLAGRGVDSHRNRFRVANLNLERVAQEFSDVYVVDVESALAGVGKRSLLDDTLYSFTHLASLGWSLVNWPGPEQIAEHRSYPDAAGLATHIGDDPDAFEVCIAAEHADLLSAIFGIDRRKCVITDLDGTLWPGILAETGRPFAWEANTGPLHSFYVGIHEALKSLAQRGILLACVSKNDEATVRELWNYKGEHHFPDQQLLHLDDFVSLRINWNDKVDNILSVAAELQLAREHIIFIDDNPIERERVRQFIPEVLVVGDDLFDLRRWLLTDPRLQPITITPESAARATLVKARRQRDCLRDSLGDQTAFRESLELISEVTRLRSGTDVHRLRELFERTTQFNTTGRQFTTAELSTMLEHDDCDIFSLRVRDRFGDHGTVGGCVVEAGHITALAVSCRVLGIGVEHDFVTRILDDLSQRHKILTASLTITPRNIPVRSIYKDHGFSQDDVGHWRIELTEGTQATDRRA